jgi:hypothetical protein
MTARSLATPLVVGALVVVMQHTDPVPRQPGFVTNGHYHHIASGVEFPVPKDWSVLSTSASSDEGDQVYLGNATADFIGQGHGQVEYFTWIFTERTRVQFDVRGSDPQASQTDARFQEIVRAARIP